MTLDEVKDKIAKDHGYFKWFNLAAANAEIFEEVCELYARSKWDEACEAQRIVCFKEYMKTEYPYYGDAIRNAPKPEFK